MIRFLAHFLCLLIASGLATSTVFGSPVKGVVKSSKIVSPIIVNGNKRIESGTVISYLKFSKPADANDYTINASIKSLYSTGLFSSVNISRQNNTVHVDVVENPIVNRIAFEGNDKVDDDTFEKFFGDRIRARNIFKLSDIKSLTNDILKIYRAQGRFLTKVDPQIIHLSDNRVNVVFNIKEGPMALIRQILFSGNKAFSDEKIKSKLQSREHTWWCFWTSDDIYAPEKVELDKKEITNFYKRNGYIDIKVLSSIAELSQDRKSFFLTYKISEGEPYTVDAIDIETNIEHINKKALLDKVQQKIGNLYCLDDVEDSENGMLEVLAEEGFIFAEVSSSVKKLEGNKVKLIFKVSRGPKVYINNIKIIGNLITLDSVIRREFQIEEQDALNSVKLRESNNRIRDLDFFSNVDIDTQPGPTQDTVDILVKVSEKSTTQIQLGLGVQIGSGLFGQISLLEKNFLGTGRSMGAAVEIGQHTRAASMSVTEPYFMGRKLALTLDAGAAQSKREKTTSLKSESLFAGCSIGYDITKYLSHAVGYKLSLDRAKNYRPYSYMHVLEIIKPEARKGLGLPDPATMTDAEKKECDNLTVDDYGNMTRSKLYSVLTLAVLDSYLTPRKGYVFSMTNTFCGLGGNVKYNSHVFSAKCFIPVGRTWTGVIKGEFGLMSHKALLDDRFSLGGDDLKGFDYDGVGPREKFPQAYAVRGTRYYSGTVALKMPILDGDMPLDGIVFMQFGSLWKSNKSKKFVHDDKKLRASVGLGLEWQSPMGPIAFTYSHAFKKRKYDETQRLQIGYFITR